MEIHLNGKSTPPIYRQIVEQVMQLVANNQLSPGERVPTVRQLAHTLEINPATVARAYQELEQQGILGASRRRGTLVLGESESPQRAHIRQNRLSNIVNNSILEALSLSYSPEELEAAFTLQLARWRIQRETGETKSSVLPRAKSRSGITIVGSNDLALNLLVNRLRYSNPEINIKIVTSGSLGGLLALQGGKADMAGVHLLDEETGEYNYPYIKHVLKGTEVAVVHLVDRIQGLMVARGNPKHIAGLQDLKRPDLVFVNRQKGSGTRVWLDYKLRELGINPQGVKGFNRELDTHMAVANSIVRRQADVGMGIQAAATSCNLDFIPLTKERFDLVIPLPNYRSKLFAPLLQTIKSAEFKNVVNNMGGYDTAQTGDTILVK